MIYGEFAITSDGMGIQIMRLPELGSGNTSWDASKRILSVHPTAFLDGAPPSLPELVVSLPLGIDCTPLPPIIDSAFPHTAHLPLGTPIVFDVFLYSQEYFTPSSSRGQTANRYRLDLHGLEHGIPKDLSQIKGSLTVLNTFSFKNGPAGSFLHSANQDVNPIDPAHPLDVTGYIDLARNYDPARREQVLIRGLTAYTLIPHQHPKINRPQSEHAKAWAYVGSGHMDRPTTSAVELVTLYGEARWRITQRQICGWTGRIVQQFETPGDRDTYGYDVSDYVYR